MMIAAYVSVECVGARPAAVDNGSCSAIVRHGRLSAPSPCIARSLPATTLSTPHADCMAAAHCQIAAPPFLH